jgi:hypothetical protein
MSQTTEKAFETYVEEILLTRGGWKSGSNAEWDKERALFPAQVFAFIQDTQSKLWEEMKISTRRGWSRCSSARWSRNWTQRVRSMCCGTGSSFTARPFASPTSNRRTAPIGKSGAVRQKPADGDAASALSSERQPDAGHGAGGERPAGFNHRVEESRHGPELAARGAPIQGRPRSARAACSSSRSGRWCISPLTRKRST